MIVVTVLLFCLLGYLQNADLGGVSCSRAARGSSLSQR